MNTTSEGVAAEIADVLREAKSMGYTARSVLTVARHRVAIAFGRKVRTPTSADTRLYLDALDGKEIDGARLAITHLRRMVERLETALRRQTGEETERAVLAGEIPEGDDILQCDIATAAEPAQPQVERVVRRGTVRVFSNIYENHAALEPRHGETVQVAYDVADAATVSVKDMDGRPICEAKKASADARLYVPAAASCRTSRRNRSIAARLKSASLALNLENWPCGTSNPLPNAFSSPLPFLAAVP